MTLSFERALVTGGAGFIGSHLVDRLLQEDCNVTVIDDLSSGSKRNLTQHACNKKLHFQKIDVRNPVKLKQALKDVERVFHEAAIVSSEYATQNPVRTTLINVHGTLNLLEAARKQDLDHLTYASSAAVYGANNHLPIKEESLTKPLSPYGASKLAAELFVQTYKTTYGLKTTSLRYFNVYGPRQIQNPYSGVITIFLQRLQAGQAIEVQGDGEQTRDFIYVTDVVEANLKAASSKKSAGEVFNIATGVPTSVNALADTLGTILDRDVVKQKVSPRQGDIRHSYANTSKAEEVLNFKAKVSFREGLHRYVKWLKRPKPTLALE